VHSFCSFESTSRSFRSLRWMWPVTWSGCPARSGRSPPATSRRHASSKASWYRISWLRSSSAPRGADRASSTAPTTAAHSGVRSPVRTPAPPNVVSSFTARSSNLGASWSGTSGRERASISAGRGHPHLRGADQDRVGAVPAVVGELVGPAADGAGVGLRRQVPVGQRGDDPGVGVLAAGPARVIDRGGFGDAGLVDQPRAGAVLAVFAVALGGGERGQVGGPGGGEAGAGAFQHGQAPGLDLRRHPGRVGGGQVGQGRVEELEGAGLAGDGGGGVHRVLTSCP